MVPYWRFKGMVLDLKRGSTRLRFIDTTLHGRKVRGMPISLGVRPQASALRFVTEGLNHLFIWPAPFREVFGEIDRRLKEAEEVSPSGGHTSQDLLLRTYIGETRSVIYLPAYIKGQMVVDAITDEPLTLYSSLQGIDINRAPEQRPGFLPALCPHCGWDLEAQRDSMVLYCRNCQRTYLPERDTFREVPFSVALSVDGPQEDNTIYIPFWRFYAEVRPFELENYNDLLRFANLPRLPRKRWQQRRFSFWVPAVKLQPERFLQATRTATLAQLETSGEGKIPGGRIFTATLPPSEAEEMLLTVLFEISRPRRRVIDAFGQIDIRVQRWEIVLVPFKETPYLFVQPDMRLGISKGLLRYGRNM